MSKALDKLKEHNAGKWWIDVATGTAINSSKFLRETPVGGFLRNTGRNILLPSLYGRDSNVVFVSASKNIALRYAMGLAARHTYKWIRPYPRIAYNQLLKERFENMERIKRERENIESKRIVDGGKEVVSNKGYRNKYTGSDIYDYLELSIPVNVPKYIMDINNNVEGGQKFVNTLFTISTQSEKNLILTRVQGRDTTRKEYISGGDLNITIRGQIAGDEADVFPEHDVNNFIALMEYAGILEVDNFLLRTHNVTHLLIKNYSITPKEGYTNVVDFNFTAVGIAPEEQVIYQLKKEQEIHANAITVNDWVSTTKVGTEKTTIDKLIKITNKWL